MDIVLLEPEIPTNAGNIARTCAATGCSLHLIRPLGFLLSEKHLKRAGLDYWEFLNMTVHDSYEDFCRAFAGRNIFMATTKAKQIYTDVEYNSDSVIMFGKESAGIPEEILVTNNKSCVRIPMDESARSLNLANSVAVVVYEALRQQNFSNLKTSGQLHRLRDSTEIK